jgi:hypothetical protein
MLLIDDKLISWEVLQEHFACDLNACKGACCWEGDLGAPLEPEETIILDDIYPKVAPFLREEGRRAIAEQGTWVDIEEEAYHTPLIKGRDCAYLTYNELGIALCGIEQAYRAGAIDFCKPISCHLYPIRVLKLPDYDALNYDRWSICSAACQKGERQKIRVFEFLREPLIRKYGEEFYQALVEAADNAPQPPMKKSR